MSYSEGRVMIRFGLSNNLFIPTHFFAENYVISHVIIFLAETNVKCCSEKFHKIIWKTGNSGDKVLS